MMIQAIVHVGIIKDKDGNGAWTTTAVEYPDGSDIKSLSLTGSPYDISDKEYSPPMEGKIVVTSEKVDWASESRRVLVSN